MRTPSFNRVDSGVASIARGFRPQNFYAATKPIYTLPGDHALSGLGLESISMLKIDVEGAELEVVQGLHKTIKTFCPFIHFEVLNHFLIVSWQALDSQTIAFREARVAKLEKALNNLGYIIYQVFQNGDIQKVKMIQPEIVPDHSNANYFAVHHSFNAPFLTCLP